VGVATPLDVGEGSPLARERIWSRSTICGVGVSPWSVEGGAFIAEAAAASAGAGAWEAAVEVDEEGAGGSVGAEVEWVAASRAACKRSDLDIGWRGWPGVVSVASAATAVKMLEAPRGSPRASWR
jgi:hypothetical protein